MRTTLAEERRRAADKSRQNREFGNERERFEENNNYEYYRNEENVDSSNTRTYSYIGTRI